MSEYRRWVSYIYNYDRGIKTTSTGYVRMESRNGKCRITLNIKGGIAMGENLRMFLFYRDRADLILINIGEGHFYNGICEFSAHTQVEDIFGSGMNIESMSGVIAYSTMDRFYGTEWDDKPIVLRRLITHEQFNVNKKKLSVVEIDSIEQGEIEEKSSKETIIKEELEEAAKEAISDEVVTAKAKEELEELVKEAKVDEESSPIEEEKSTDKKLEEIEIEEIMPEEMQKEQPMSNMLMRIFTNMPGMYPFEDDDIMECVKFEPQDIGIFPMDKWQLASNSFLLHGYYTYRHLIFARRRTVEGAKCMLGVPGMFRDREKFMAKMFGFGNFKGVRGKAIPGYGEFGYWYMDIDMD